MPPVLKNIVKVTLGSSGSNVNGTNANGFKLVKFCIRRGHYLAVTNDGAIYLGDFLSNKIASVQKLKAVCTALSVFINNENEMALIGLESGSILKFNIDTRKIAVSHSGLGEPVLNFSLHPWSERAIAVYRSSAVTWDVSSENFVPLQRLNTGEDLPLLDAFFCINGDVIITCFSNGNIALWDFPSLEFLSQLLDEEGKSPEQISLVAQSEDASVLLALCANSKLLMWTIDNARDVYIKVFHLPMPLAGIRQMDVLTLSATSTLTRFAVFLIDNGRLYFLHLDSGKVLAEHSAKVGTFVRFFLSPRSSNEDQRSMAIILDDGGLEITNVSKLQRLIPKAETQTSKTPTAKGSDRFRTNGDLSLVNETRRKDEVPSAPRAISPDVKRAPVIVNLRELSNMLEKFGEFPKKHRSMIWKHLLGLPLNREAFATLLARNIHPSYEHLERTFPVAQQELLLDLKIILSALAHWCPLFAEVRFLPVLVFPFIKILRENRLLCFETIMTYLVNWCQDWFCFYPAPPFQVLAKIDYCLEKASPQLLANFKALGVTARIYAWPLLESSFSDVFTADEWLQIWDHIFVSLDIYFLYALVAAYFVVSENTLLGCKSSEEIQKYCYEKNPVPVKSVIQKAKEITELAFQQPQRSEERPRPFTRLPQATYPVFADYPLAAVANHAHQMKKIRQLEADYVRQRQAVLSLESEFGTLQEQEEHWKRREAVLRAAESLQRQESVREEQRLLEQRARLQILKKEMLAKELVIMEAKKLQLIRDDQLRKEAHLARLEDNKRCLAILRQSELDEAVENDDMIQLKQQLEQYRFEVELRKGGTKIDVESHQATAVESNKQVEALPPETSRIDADNSNQENDSLSLTAYNCNSLDEKLTQLEDNNKKMEKEINELIQKLGTF